jgi:two-component system response regulator (stage 0 sporulation protein A)
MVSIEDPDNVENLSKIIYPKVGMMNGTNVYNVERSIRHSIDLMWKGYKGNATTFFSLDSEAKPTNKKFIKFILQHLST